MSAPFDIWVATFGFLNNSQKEQVQFTYLLASLGTAVTDNDLWNDLKGALRAVNGLSDKIESALAANVEITYLRGQRVYPNRSVIREITIGQFGDVTQNAEAQNLAGVITRRTLFGGRSQVSNIHLPGVGKDQVTAGLLNIDQLARNQAVLDKSLESLVGPTTGSTWLPIIYHSKKLPAGSYDLVATGVAQPTVRTMRRRTVGVGK